MSFIKVKLCPGIEPKIIVETLSRMGIANRKDRIIYPSCYLYPENGEFFICHFKELFVRNNYGFNNISEDDIKRRNSIIYCLVKWKMVEVLEGSIEPHEQYVYTIPHREKSEWTIKHKYRLRYE